MAEQVPLNRVLTALDKKDRGFYDSLTDEEKKGLSPFLLVRYASAVQGIPALEEYYLMATNHYVNKDFFNINKHPKLQWLCLTAVSPNMGAQMHKWIGMKKKGTANKKENEKRNLLAKIHPTLKDEDIDILTKLVSDDEIKNYRKCAGDDA